MDTHTNQRNQKVKLLRKVDSANVLRFMRIFGTNGDQHYHAVDHFGGDEGYKMTVLRDEMKKEYCSKNHIPLLILNKNNNLKVDIETFINEVWD